MLKMKKRSAAIIVGIALLLTTWGGTAFAAQTDAQLTFDGFEENFELTKDNISGAVKEGSNFSQIDGSNIVSENKAQVADGVFGKAAGDKAVHFFRSESSTSVDAGNGVKLGLAGTMSEGEYTEIEIYMAWDNNCNATKGVLGFYRNTGGTGQSRTQNDGVTDSYLFSVNKEGILYVMGENTGIYLPAEKWYKFNLVMKAGTGSTTTADNGNKKDAYGNYIVTDSSLNTNRYWFYLDNTPIKEDVVLNAFGRGQTGWNGKYVDFSGFSYIYPEMRTTDKSASSGVWIDDISVSQGIAELPSYTNSSIEVSDAADQSSAARLYSGAANGLTQFVDERVDLSELTVGGEAFGEAGSRLAAGEKAYAALNAGGEKLYAMAVNTTRQEKVYDMSSDSPRATFGGDAGSVSNVTEGVAGSADGNSYMKIQAKTSVVWKDQEDSTVTLYPGHSGSNAPKTIEASVLMNGSREFRITMKSNAGKWYTPVVAEADGHVTVDRYTHRRIMPGTWARYAVTLYPAAGKAEVYLNGELIAVTGCDTTMKSVAYLRLIGKFAKGEDGNNAQGYIAYDDIHMYNGARPANEPALKLTSRTMTVGDGVIFVPETAADQGSFYADLNVTGGDLDNAFICKNSALSEKISESDDISEGNIFVVPRNLDNSAVAYSYYYLAKGGAAPLGIAEISKSLAVGKNEGVSVTVNFYKPVSSCSALIFAKYNGSKLTGIAKSEINAVEIAGHSGDYSYPYQVTTEPFSITVGEGETVKAFIFSSMNGLMPLLSNGQTVFGR